LNNRRLDGRGLMMRTGIITAVQQQQKKTTHEPDKKLHQNLRAVIHPAPRDGILKTG
jgi:hypothetical protein